MKKFLLLSILTLCFVGLKAQVTMTPSGTTDSATVKYITATIAGGYAQLSIHVTLTKNAAVGGAALAGYAILQASDDGVTFVDVPTWKKYTNVAQPGNVFDTDTFTLTTSSAAQPKIWQVTTFNTDGHPYYYYRVKLVITTSSVSGTGRYILRKKL